MIRNEQYHKGLRALQRLIIHAKAQAYQAGEATVGDLLNDVEMLPECLADERDRTEEFAELLHGIAQMHPGCQYIIEEFERSQAVVS